MQEITIQKSEYDELLKAKNQAESFAKEISRLETENQNKTVALEEARTKAKENKRELEEKLSFETEKTKTLRDLVGLVESDDFDKLKNSISSFKDKSLKFDIFENQRLEGVKNSISDLEKKLGEDFIKSKVSLFEGLADEKKLTMLQEFATIKGLDKQAPQVVPQQGNPPDNGNISKFEQALQSGASSKDLISNLD